MNDKAYVERETKNTYFLIKYYNKINNRIKNILENLNSTMV